jgi:hypothetical protein
VLFGAAQNFKWLMLERNNLEWFGHSSLMDVGQELFLV